MPQVHLHELLLRRMQSDGSSSLVRFNAFSLSSKDPQEDMIAFAEGVAKAGTLFDESADAIVYKVDGKCEFYVSRAFYAYPNYTDRQEDRNGKNPGKGQSRRDQQPRRSA